ncbi:MAG: restriction endonuclease subunit S [Methanomicrobiales archaeon]
MEMQFKTIRLGDVCDKIGSGATPRGGTEVYHSTGIALIRRQNIYCEGFKKNGLAFIDEKQAQELENVQVKRNDVLLNITGDSVARVCQVPEDVLPARVNQHVAIIRPNSDILDASYLRYYLVNEPIQQNLLALSSAGATRNALTKTMIESLQISTPPLPTQRAIAHILGTLDVKIELNRKMNETLEAMAQAIFKSWFVDFDPVRAKMDGKQPAGMDPETAALFPSEFEMLDRREVPKGWKVGILEHIAENVRRPIKPEQIDPTTPYIGLEHMPQHSIALSDWGNAESVESGKFEYFKDEFLFGKLRPYFHKVGIAPTNGICSTDILVIIPKTEIWASYVICCISNSEFVEYANIGSDGTKMPRTKWSILKNYIIILPPQNIIDPINDLLQRIFEKINANIHQSRSLTALRDIILPKLISGELDLGIKEGI